MINLILEFSYFSHYRRAVGGIIVFSSIDKKSVESLDSWIEELRFYAEKDIEILIVANKRDKT